MDYVALAIAREEWTHQIAIPPSMTLCADDLIALAVGQVRQFHWHTAALTVEDFVILERRAGPRTAWGAHGRVGFAYLRHLNT